MNSVGNDVKPEELNCEERNRKVESDRKAKEQDFGEAAGKEKIGNFSDVGVCGAAFFYSGDNRSEIIIRNNHIGGFASDVGAATHGDADVRGF